MSFLLFDEKLSFYCPFWLTLSQGVSFCLNNVVVPGILALLNQNNLGESWHLFGLLTLSKIHNVSFFAHFEYCRIFRYLYKLFRVMTRLSNTLKKVSLVTVRIFALYTLFGNVKNSFSHNSVSDLRSACIAIFCCWQII